MYFLNREIDLRVNSAELWNFIATPRNLNRLTPPYLKFRILSDPPQEMFNGLLILYEITIPRFGKQRWLTEIKHVRAGLSFVDEQRFGPYKFWYHYHEITALDNSSCRMCDQVSYALPFGPLGRLLHQLAVKKMLADIFAYRSQRLLELFG